MKRRLAWLAAVLAQLALLGWIVASQERLRVTGRAVVLAIEPFDPIDPLSGRYLRIRARATRIDLAELHPGWNGEALEQHAEQFVGQEVAVTLRAAGERFEPEAVASTAYQEPGGSIVWLRGRVRSRYGAVLEIDYGLDRFFIPSDAADPSALLWQGGHELDIVVRVAVDGRSSIEDLLVDGKRYAEWNAAQGK